MSLQNFYRTHVHVCMQNELPHLDVLKSSICNIYHYHTYTHINDIPGIYRLTNMLHTWRYEMHSNYVYCVAVGSNYCSQP